MKSHSVSKVKAVTAGTRSKGGSSRWHLMAKVRQEQLRQSNDSLRQKKQTKETYEEVDKSIISSMSEQTYSLSRGPTGKGSSSMCMAQPDQYQEVRFVASSSEGGKLHDTGKA